ncbi:MAG: PAS domain-containing protein [Planctomycetes bacterium]|nr:PAS domain-containing protein [Planctomycetota bacterium]
MSEHSVVIIGGRSLCPEAASSSSGNEAATFLGMSVVPNVGWLLARAGQQAPACVVVDVADYESALDICRRLRTEPALRYAAVVLVADVDKASQLSASFAESGVDEVIFRPVRPESLPGTVAVALSRRRASLELSPSAAMLPQRVLNDILDGTPVAMFVIDVDHRVTYWNRACEELTGVRRKAVLGQPIDGAVFYQGVQRPLLAEVVLDGDFDTLHRLYNGKGVTVSTAIRGAYEATDDLVMRGWKRTVYFLAALLYSADGKVTGAIETLQDISEQRQAEMRLSQYQQRLRMLASELSLVEKRERRELAAALHDGIGQRLFAIKAKAALMRDLGLQDRQADLLRQMLEQIDLTIQEARTLTIELCPPLLYEVGLAAALKWLAEQFGRRTGIRTEFRGEEVKDRLSDDLRAAVFHSVRELLNNVERHAGASRVVVSMAAHDGELHVDVQDDGRGFEKSPPSGPSESPSGFGLFSIRERLIAVGGRVQIDSAAGSGTHVALVMPGHGQPGKEGRGT